MWRNIFGDCVEEVGLDMETRGIELGYFNYVDEDVVVIADAEQDEASDQQHYRKFAQISGQRKGYFKYPHQGMTAILSRLSSRTTERNRGEGSAVYFRPFLPDGFVEIRQRAAAASGFRS